MKKQFHTTLEGLLFKAAKAATAKEFNEKMGWIEALDEEAAAYIAEIPKEKWARAFFPLPRLGHVTSNIAESMNRWLEEARWQDPVGLFSTYILKLNALFEKRRDKYSSMRGNALPKRVAECFDKSIRKSRKLSVLRHTRTLSQVQTDEQKRGWKIVDLENVTCTCGFYLEFGFPCKHMCAALISLNDENPGRFIQHKRLRAALIQTYFGVTRPVDIDELTSDGMKPPVGTKKRGMPKQKRIASAAEQKLKTVTCSRCGTRGHNSRTCKHKKN